ncbi:MAG: hypothetical protein IRZ16_22735 [Myxococcaceae bacterium]|nr:hypothetical protein [Myxococcaceae bacterium]
MSFKVRIDASNPGQYFASCGLFELSARLCGDARAWFSATHFHVEAACSLSELLDAWTSCRWIQLSDEDDKESPIHFPKPFNLLIDWWKDESTGGRELKVWAGTMSGPRIAQAMIAALRDRRFHHEGLFEEGCIVYDPEEPKKKVEPFYFDARRAPNAHSRDIGFSPNDLDLTTTAFPAVEALCLVGLQRFRPAATEHRRILDYFVWPEPVPLSVAGAISCGAVRLPGVRAFRFENWFRTSQKKHKAFRPAVQLKEGK